MFLSVLSYLKLEKGGNSLVATQKESYEELIGIIVRGVNFRLKSVTLYGYTKNHC